MQSPFNRASAALGFSAYSLEVPGFLRPVAGQNQQPACRAKTICHPREPQAGTWAMRVAMGLEAEAGLKYMHSTVLQQ